MELIRTGIRFFKDIRKYWNFLIVGTKAQLRSEVNNSFLDWLWWILEPFCNMLVYTFIFGYVFHASEEYFPIFVFIGISMWGFFSRNLNASVKLIEANRGIVTKVYIPKQILLLKVMFVNFFKMLLAFVVIAVMMGIYRVPVNICLAYMAPVFLLLFLLTYGICCFLMHFGIYMEDLHYIVGIVLNMMMYFTGTFYNIAKRVPAPYGTILSQANPVAFLISSMRNAMLSRLGINKGLYVVWFAAAILIALLGTRLIYKNENSYVKVI